VGVPAVTDVAVLDVRVTAEHGIRSRWWLHLHPSEVHLGDLVDLSEDVTHININSIRTLSLWMVTHVTLEQPGSYRLGFLPADTGRGGQIELHYDYRTRLRVNR
jgi:hypothetical protein